VAVFHARDHPEALAFDDDVVTLAGLAFFPLIDEGLVFADEAFPEVVDFLDFHDLPFEGFILELDAFGFLVQTGGVVEARLDLLVDVPFARAFVHFDFPLEGVVILSQGERGEAEREERES
jgi:hypothetical protein